MVLFSRLSVGQFSICLFISGMTQILLFETEDRSWSNIEPINITHEFFIYCL